MTLALGLTCIFVPDAIAADPPKEVSWWSQLLQAHNGTSFCLPPDTKDIDVAKALQGFIQANHLPEALTELQAVQLLAQIFPCSGRGLGNDKLKLKDVLSDPVFQQGVVGAAPLLPGTTPADPLLQKDAVAISAVGGVPTECQSLYVADTEFLDHEGSALEGSHGAAWRALWTLAFCTGRAQVPLRFVPDGKGKRIMIGPTASKVAPSPPQR